MSSDEELDDLPDLDEAVAKARGGCNFQVSGWDNENDGIEEEKNPHESPSKEILWAAENGKIDVVKKLVIANKSLVNAADKDGYTPLHRACYNDHVDIVKFLLANGSRVDAETVDNWQPLHSACKWNSLECVAALLSYGADINAASKGGVTPLHLSAGHAEAERVLQLLLSQTEMVHDVKNQAGDTPTEIAERCGPHGPLFECTEPCFQ